MMRCSTAVAPLLLLILLVSIAAQTCRNGFDGIEGGNSCCDIGCRACTSRANCANNQDNGLGGDDCCADQIVANGVSCSDVTEAPCILETFDTVCDSNGLAGFEGTADDGVTLICCSNGCGQCTVGGGCATAYAPLDASDCCSNTVEADGNFCSVTQESPCIITGVCGVDVVCDDPHMQGLRGQTIDWSGVDGGWYSLIKDDDVDLHINVRLTAPLPEEFPDRQLVTGLSVMTEGHSLVIEVKNPYDISTEGCPEGMSPCLANGGLRAVVDGQEVNDVLQFSRQNPVAGNVFSVSASNLPVECRQFGGDKIWARMYDEMLQGRRVLAVEDSLEDWILSFAKMAAPQWCVKYIAENNLGDLQSTHAIFKIDTPTVTVRLNAGINHQGDGERDWTGRLLPDLEFWQMDVGLDGLDIESPLLSGILGETARPVKDDKTGLDVMEGFEAFRGTVEDYRVSGSLGTQFALLDHMNRGQE